MMHKRYFECDVDGEDEEKIKVQIRKDAFNESEV